jgi:tryptophanase
LKGGDIVPNNTHFDTTRANVEHHKAVALDIPISEARSPSVVLPFKGNIDLELLEEQLLRNKQKIPIVFVTITNNSGGGQPVSMANIRGASHICKKFSVPFFLDACRFAENAWFIKMREEGYAGKSPLEIAQELFSLADGCTMSAKKDGLANIGGFLALNDDSLAQACKNELVSYLQQRRALRTIVPFIVLQSVPRCRFALKGSRRMEGWPGTTLRLLLSVSKKYLRRII